MPGATFRPSPIPLTRLRVFRSLPFRPLPFHAQPLAAQCEPAAPPGVGPRPAPARSRRGAPAQGRPREGPGRRRAGPRSGARGYMAVIPRPGLVGASTGQLGASPGTLREGPAQRGRAVRPGPAGFDSAGGLRQRATTPADRHEQRGENEGQQLPGSAERGEGQQGTRSEEPPSSASMATSARRLPSSAGAGASPARPQGTPQLSQPGRPRTGARSFLAGLDASRLARSPNPGRRQVATLAGGADPSGDRAAVVAAGVG